MHFNAIFLAVSTLALASQALVIPHDKRSSLAVRGHDGDHDEPEGVAASVTADSHDIQQRADSLFLDDSTQADELDKRSDSDGDSDGESDGDSDGDDDDSFDDNPSASDRARSGQAGGRQAANRVDDSRSRNRVDDNPSASDRAAARRGGRRNRTAPSTA